jgi:hypothetical protein
LRRIVVDHQSWMQYSSSACALPFQIRLYQSYSTRAVPMFDPAAFFQRRSSWTFRNPTGFSAT